jgi:hypothetical protein
MSLKGHSKSQRCHPSGSHPCYPRKRSWLLGSENIHHRRNGRDSRKESREGIQVAKGQQKGRMTVRNRTLLVSKVVAARKKKATCWCSGHINRWSSDPQELRNCFINI